MPFKVCTFCRKVWETRDDFLGDPELTLVGYQVNYGDLVAGLFLFHHSVPECGTSLAIEAGEFVDMHDGPIFDQCLSGTELCEGHCGRTHDLGPCPNKCECAYVRDVLQKVKDWPKQDVRQPA